MVVLALRELGDAIHERDRVAEAAELELALQLAVDLVPPRQHAVHCDVAVDLRVEAVLRHESLEAAEPRGGVDRGRHVGAVNGVADAETRELPRRETRVAQAQNQIPVAVAAELAVERPDLGVDGPRIGEAAREDGVVLPERLGARIVVEHLATAVRLVHEPAAPEEEASALPRGRGRKQRQMAGVLPPVVVVEPADDLPAGTVEPRRTRVDLAAALVRHRRDAGVREPERRLDPLAAAVVDNDRLPALPVLHEDARQRPCQEFRPPAGGNDHGEVHVDPG